MAKNNTLLMRFHFILIMLLCAVTGISLIYIMMKGISLPTGVTIVHFILFLSLICGTVYAGKGYQKSAANFYKAFISLSGVADLALIITTLMSRGFNPDIILIGIRVILLFVLAFGKDLGKRNTWIIFGFVLVIDLVYGIAFVPRNYLVWLILADIFGKLIIDGTIGLAIRGKYADKDARYKAANQN